MANATEEKFRANAQRWGYTPTKCGWPDFICWTGTGEAICVEVKPPGEGLTRDQWRTMMLLSRAGLKCFVSDGETLTPFDAGDPPAIDHLSTEKRHGYQSVWNRDLMDEEADLAAH